MNKQTTVRGVAAAAAALGLVLAGCGSDTTTEADSSAEETTTSAAADTGTATTTAPAEPVTENYTIAEYIKDNGITESQVKRGAPGAPTVNLPAPQGWVDAGPATPALAYSQIVYADPSMPPPPPTITAFLSKLTGDVDSAKILEFAPGELKNLPEYGGAEGQPGKLGGFDAVQVGGTYVKDGKTLLVAQKTTIIPTDDGLYVLQINAEGSEEQAVALMDATAVIDDQTTILP